MRDPSPRQTRLPRRPAKPPAARPARAQRTLDAPAGAPLAAVSLAAASLVGGGSARNRRVPDPAARLLARRIVVSAAAVAAAALERRRDGSPGQPAGVTSCRARAGRAATGMPGETAADGQCTDPTIRSMRTGAVRQVGGS